MPAQLTTKAQVNGYRFLLRRLDHALVRRDVRMLHDPMRSQVRSMLVGAVLGLLVVAGAAILAFLRPQGSIGDANIVIGKDSGALYVVVAESAQDKDDKRLHPVLNLASARLISGSSESPKSVKDAKLSSLPRGPMLGIPGAPAALPGSKQGGRSDWSLCETVQLSVTGSAASATGVQTSIFAGKPQLDERIRTMGASDALLVRRGDKTYLIYDGKRAEVDPGNSVMARSLNLAGYKPRPVGTGMLDAAIAVPPLAVPDIPRAGQPGPAKLSDVPVGGVITVGGMGRTDQSQLYVVLADGVQPVTDFAAQVIRTANSQGMREIKAEPPDVLTNMPVLHTLSLDHFPANTPKILSAEDAPVTCLTWAKGCEPDNDATESPTDRATLGLLAGNRLPLPGSAQPVRLATSDGTGDRVDTAYIPPSSGEFVQVTGTEPGSLRRGGLFYVADNGIRYGIPDVATAKVLGLTDDPRLAPWSIIGQLVPGPTLSKNDALVERDILPVGN
ncbi:type VII secretion protein EccB [Nocardia sp. NBC_00565]|uniref:type VII secretion protein EccB n=1 Tax=Nocardia sp. NBC_00565 TaxID=2975993 RepID=UPI002E8239BA|nr:type VII secretion protein EccB [Nocardia sp. NBC_00565]WUC02882.1 type VII secretion protein EccB [Nocardia sp. NBC_00565]